MILFIVYAILTQNVSKNLYIACALEKFKLSSFFFLLNCKQSLDILARSFQNSKLRVGKPKLITCSTNFIYPVDKVASEGKKIKIKDYFT